MIRISQVKINTEHTKEQLKKKAASLLRIHPKEIRRLEIVKQSLDARNKPDLYYSYTLDLELAGEEKLLQAVNSRGNRRPQIQKAETECYRFPKPGAEPLPYPPVIVGTGPAGLFCGYYLALHGYCPILLERGRDVDTRKADVERFWKDGTLDLSSNVQFGEGGAGTFSDGKLNTLVKDKDGRNKEVLKTFVKFGAKESVLYESKPHVGTDVLSRVVKNMRNEIIRLGGQVRFESQVTDLYTESGQVTGVEINGRERLCCDQLVLAVGHSARDTFFMLYEKGIPMEAKSFAVGLRVQHSQEMINESQYGRKDPGKPGAASYKVTAKASCGRGVYSFCMCPGGYVVNASSEKGRTAVNGMSYSKRDGKNANSAVIVSVSPKDFGSDHPLSGIAFQRKLEERAFLLGKGRIPVQRYGIYRECVEQGVSQEELPGEFVERACEEGIRPECKGAFEWADLSGLLPKECSRAFVEGMESFGRQIAGFNRADAVLCGVESRTSSPVRMNRDDTLQSEIKGLYPCGEGAGYAGGITSAAMDGIRVAEKIASGFRPSLQMDLTHQIK